MTSDVRKGGDATFSAGNEPRSQKYARCAAAPVATAVNGSCGSMTTRRPCTTSTAVVLVAMIRPVRGTRDGGVGRLATRAPRRAGTYA